LKATKQNIIQAALGLFNEKGFVNVRLQHIADEADVSIGNLAYHYATKKDILNAVYENLVDKQKELLNDLSIVPLFENLDRHWDTVFETQNTYSFFYQDTLEIIRFDESIRIKYRNHIRWEKDQYHRLLEFNIARGALGPMESTEVKDRSEHLWLMENSWFYYAMVSGQEDIGPKQFKSHMWQMLAPHFTHIGRQEYDRLIRNKRIPL